MIETLSTVQKLLLIGEVFLQIAANFWPVLIIGALVCISLVKHETRYNRYDERER